MASHQFPTEYKKPTIATLKHHTAYRVSLSLSMIKIQGPVSDSLHRQHRHIQGTARQSQPCMHR